MGDALDVSGGTTSVSTEDLECAVEQLRRLSAEAGSLAVRLAGIDEVGRGFHADQARVDIEVAARLLEVVAQRSGILHVLVATAARGYEYQERVVESLARSAAGSGQLVGSIFPGLAVSAGFLASVAGGLWYGLRSMGVASGPGGSNANVPTSNSVARQLNGLWNNPGAAAVARAASGAIGPFLIGTMRLPIPVGPGSYQLGAKGVLAAGRALGMFEETSVRLVETIPQATSSTTQGFLGRLDRVPNSADGDGPQVVIERYSVPGQPDRFSVFVGGTATFDTVSGEEPWDMTSNIGNAAGELSGSVASVRAAMAAAGVDSTSQVQLTGYSQGGGVVASVAASGNYNLQGVVAFGGPTGQIPIPDDVPAVIVEHAEDLVPATGGEQDNHSAVLVRRTVFEGEQIPQDRAFPAHNIREYRETARLMDESDSQQLGETLARLDSFTAGATLESRTAYKFERD